MSLNCEDLIIEVSRFGCVNPVECDCCKNFGYHAVKVKHKPTGIDISVKGLPHKDPKKVSIEFLEARIKLKQDQERTVLKRENEITGNHS